MSSTNHEDETESGEQQPLRQPDVPEQPDGALPAKAKTPTGYEEIPGNTTLSKPDITQVKISSIKLTDTYIILVLYIYARMAQFYIRIIIMI